MTAENDSSIPTGNPDQEKQPEETKETPTVYNIAGSEYTYIEGSYVPVQESSNDSEDSDDGFYDNR